MCSFVEAFRVDKRRLHNEVEELLNFIFYHVIRVSPKEKSVVLCEKLGGLRQLSDAIGYVLFTKFGVKSIYSLMSNVLPLYCIGIDTGLTVDCGFQKVEILPFC